MRHDAACPILKYAILNLFYLLKYVTEQVNNISNDARTETYEQQLEYVYLI